MLGESTSPIPQCRFSDMQSHSSLTDRLYENMYVRMRLIGMKHHSVSMLESELFPGEILHGGEHLAWRSPCRHREQQLVNQLCRAAPTSIKLQAAPMFLEI